MTSWVVVDIFWHWKGTGVIEGWAATSVRLSERTVVSLWRLISCVRREGGMDEIRTVRREDWVSF